MFGLSLPLGISALFFIFLGGCSGDSASRPVLRQRESLPIERVVLHETIRPEDIKTIFAALNEKGSLDSLAGWVEGASETELKFWADWLTEWVYQSAYDSDDLVQILKARIERRSFSSWQAQWGSRPAAWTELGRAVWGRDEFPALANQLVRLAVLERKQNPFWGIWNLPEEVSVSAVVEDLKRVAVSKSWAPLQTSLESAFQEGLVSNAARALRRIYSESGPLSLVGLSQSLETAMAPREKPEGGYYSTASRAFRLASLLDCPGYSISQETEVANCSGETIFAALQKTLFENSDAVRSLASVWDPLLTKSLAGMVRESLVRPSGTLVLDKAFWLSLPRKNPTDAPTEAYQKLFAKVFSGLDRITDPRRRSGEGDAFFYLLPLNLNAWALTSWLEEVVRLNQSKLAGHPSEGFSHTWWKLELERPQLTLELLEPPRRTEISAKAKLDFESIGKRDLVERLNTQGGKAGFGGKIYRFENEETAERIPLDEALVEALTEVHAVRPLSDFSPVLVVVARAFSEPGSDSFLSLEQLKKNSDNLLDGLNAFLANLDEARWTLFKKLVFEDLGIGNLSLEARESILRLFENSPEVGQWVSSVLDELGAIEELDHGGSDASPRTVWSLYHRILRATPPDSRPAFAKLLGEIARAQVFDLNGESGKPRHPGFYSVLSSPLVVRVLADWGQMDAGNFGAFDAAFTEAISGQGWSRLSAVMRSLVVERPEAIVGAFQGLDSENSLGISLAERDWIARFVKSGSLEKFRAFFLTHSSQANLKKLLTELDALSERGSWNRVFRLLGQIQNERAREVARVLGELEATGEWKSILFLLRQLVAG